MTRGRAKKDLVVTGAFSARAEWDEPGENANCHSEILTRRGKRILYGGFPGKNSFSPCATAPRCPVGKRILRDDDARVIARERAYRRRRARSRGMRIVSSRHEPLVKNIRSEFREKGGGEREKENEPSR